MTMKQPVKELMLTLFICAGGIAAGTSAIADAAGQPVVLELFTSQGCSSCPPADELLGRLAADPKVLPLSFHIDYWDRLGWKDPYSSRKGTERQGNYAKAMGLDSVFTPQLIVDGAISVVGSSESDVSEAIVTAGKNPRPYNIGIQPEKAGGGLNITVSGEKTPAAPDELDIVEIRFVSHAKTDVTAGENTGRNLESVNNVTAINSIGKCRNEKCSYRLSPLRSPDDGIAIIAQSPDNGRILGSAAYKTSR
jgi:hypothetical protein